MIVLLLVLAVAAAVVIAGFVFAYRAGKGSHNASLAGWSSPAWKPWCCCWRFWPCSRGTVAAPVRQLDAGDDTSWIGRVDFAYPDEKILIELDGRRHHSTRLDLEADRVRDNRLVAGGWRVIRITWAQLHERPDEVIAVIRALLDAAAA